ncbi:MAG TPA: GT4 family glycosyltransferase PelF [Oscillospiraceae bacterium]|nr:GT4 family glycosyltransferase PelF [Oscillospiraceae bacterium]
MKVCLIAEGSYPYVAGGVSSWIHSIVSTFSEIEFSLLTVVSDRSLRGKFLYELPANLVSVTEVYLQDYDWGGRKGDNRMNKVHMNSNEYDALKSLVLGGEINWGDIFTYFEVHDVLVNDLLMSSEFLNIVKEYCYTKQMNMTFTDFLWTVRSICLPLFMILKCQPPHADIYHCVATGYAGVIGSMAKHLYPKSTLLVSEHGIYTREREEEIIKAKWVKGIYKDIWIEQFLKMSNCAYKYADKVTALFQRAYELQIELGCPAEKIVITPNGIDTDVFTNIPTKNDDDPYINVGAFLRITPIKDVKTMISAFYYAQREMPELKLWIMGSEDEDPHYVQECRDLVVSLGAKNIVFTGRIETTDYIGKMDFTLLTSISEGQPLAILESFAAKKPCIATNVGNCYGLIYGEADDYGAAGIVVPALDINRISNAILKLARNELLCRQMGEIGYRRVVNKYKWEYLIDSYQQIYSELFVRSGVSLPELYGA